MGTRSSNSSLDEPGGAGTRGRSLAVSITNGGTDAPADLVRRLGDTLAEAGKVLGAFGEVRVRLVLDAEMAQAHEEFAGVPGTTDVLTFDLTDPEEDPIDGPTVALVSDQIKVAKIRRVDTDILVCVDEGKRQAAKRGHELFHELLLYSLHGVLHCLGHDDHDEAAFAAMHDLEDAVLTRLGVGVVFRRDEQGSHDGGVA
jgi:probable rRNA maturation factor